MKKAFTMVEVILVTVIVVVISTALITTFVTCLALNENSRMMTIAMNIARDKIEETINSKANWTGPLLSSRSYGISALSKAPSLGGYSFNGSCQVLVFEKAPTLKLARVAVCWKLKNGRVVGSDLNLNGQSDSVETWEVWGGATAITSPVVITTAILQGS